MGYRGIRATLLYKRQSWGIGMVSWSRPTHFGIDWSWGLHGCYNVGLQEFELRTLYKVATFHLFYSPICYWLCFAGADDIFLTDTDIGSIVSLRIISCTVYLVWFFSLMLIPCHKLRSSDMMQAFKQSLRIHYTLQHPSSKWNYSLSLYFEAGNFLEMFVGLP